MRLGSLIVVPSAWGRFLSPSANSLHREPSPSFFSATPQRVSPVWMVYCRASAWSVGCDGVSSSWVSSSWVEIEDPLVLGWAVMAVAGVPAPMASTAATRAPARACCGRSPASCGAVTLFRAARASTSTENTNEAQKPQPISGRMVPSRKVPPKSTPVSACCSSGMVGIGLPANRIRAAGMPTMSSSSTSSAPRPLRVRIVVSPPQDGGFRGLIRQ